MGSSGLRPLSTEERAALYPTPPETEAERILLLERYLLDLDAEAERYRVALRAIQACDPFRDGEYGPREIARRALLGSDDDHA